MRRFSESVPIIYFKIEFHRKNAPNASLNIKRGSSDARATLKGRENGSIRAIAAEISRVGSVLKLILKRGDSLGIFISGLKIRQKREKVRQIFAKVFANKRSLNAARAHFKVDAIFGRARENFYCKKTVNFRYARAAVSAKALAKNVTFKLALV